MKKAEEIKKKEAVLFFTSNLPVYAKIIAATRSALHKRGTLDDVASPGIAFNTDDLHETCFDVAPVCPDGYSTDYAFTFCIGTANSAMVIKKCGEPYGEPLGVQDFLADLEALEANIGAHIDSQIGDKLVEKEKEPLFLDLYPNIAVQISDIVSATRKIFISFGAEDVKVIPALKRPASDAEGISFYIEPVVYPNDYSEYSLSFSINKEGTSMKIIREGNDFGISKCIGNALSSAKEIFAFIREEIYAQILNSGNDLIRSR